MFCVQSHRMTITESLVNVMSTSGLLCNDRIFQDIVIKISVHVKHVASKQAQLL